MNRRNRNSDAGQSPTQDGLSRASRLECYGPKAVRALFLAVVSFASCAPTHNDALRVRELQVVDAAGNVVAEVKDNGRGGAVLRMLGDGKERFRVDSSPDRVDLIIDLDSDPPPYVHILCDRARGGVINVFGANGSAKIPE